MHRNLPNVCDGCRPELLHLSATGRRRERRPEARRQPRTPAPPRSSHGRPRAPSPGQNWPPASCAAWDLARSPTGASRGGVGRTRAVHVCQPESIRPRADGSQEHTEHWVELNARVFLALRTTCSLFWFFILLFVAIKTDKRKKGRTWSSAPACACHPARQIVPRAMAAT